MQAMVKGDREAFYEYELKAREPKAGCRRSGGWRR